MFKQPCQIMLSLVFIPFGLFAQNPGTIAYDTVSRDRSIVFYFPDTTGNFYLRKLRDEYQLLQLVKGRSSDKEKALAMMNWTHKQWKHNGSSTPSKVDALTILKEAREGKSFRCVEYSTVLATSLMAIGYKARQVDLKTKDAETAQHGAGHVLTEIWLQDYKKWALIDAQFNLMPQINDVPLNAVELQEAITSNKDFKLINDAGQVNNFIHKYYIQFIKPYLYFMNTSIDNRDLPATERKLINGKTDLMLVPLGAKKPELFQQIFKIDYAYYTHALKEFYQEP